MENNLQDLINNISLSKSGSYIKSILNKNPELVKYLDTILKQYPFLKTYQDSLYFIKNNNCMPYCKTCNKEIPYIKIRRGIRYCSYKCRSNNINVKEKTKNTNLEKYGTDNPAKANSIKEKIKQTNLKKYNTISPLQNPEIHKKAINTLLTKYGVDNASKNKEIYKKYQNTMLKKYNVKASAQSPKILEKMHNTCIKRYGKKSPMQSEHGQNNYKNTCLLKYGFDNVKKIEIWNQILSWKDFIIPNFNKEDYIDKNTEYEWKCVKCGNIFKQRIYTTHFHEQFGSLPRCLNCYPKGKSGSEKELLDFCKNYFPNVISVDRNLIKPLELDIVIPNIKLAIEFNGIYWHSTNSILIQNYHLNKTELCEEKNYRLIHIWEDEWNENKEEIKQKLINIFNNTEIIDYSKILDRCWFPAKQIEGYNLEILPPTIIEKKNYKIENCGYLKYTKII